MDWLSTWSDSLLEIESHRGKFDSKIEKNHNYPLKFFIRCSR